MMTDSEGEPLSAKPKNGAPEPSSVMTALQVQAVAGVLFNAAHPHLYWGSSSAAVRSDWIQVVASALVAVGVRLVP